VFSHDSGAFIDNLNAASSLQSQRGQVIEEYDVQLSRLALRKKAAAAEVKALAKTRTILASLTFIAFALTATRSFADEAKVPTTTAEHEALAKQYKDEAAQYKKTADEHRAMAALYAKAHPDAKGGAKNPWNDKMKKHCEALSKDADKLAADAEKAADFHTSRAKELTGK
jgi:hypothetical protein